jgi:hypothetical protein
MNKKYTPSLGPGVPNSNCMAGKKIGDQNGYVLTHSKDILIKETSLANKIINLGAKLKASESHNWSEGRCQFHQR